MTSAGKKSLSFAISIFFIAASLVCLAAAQDRPDSAEALNNQAIQAYRAKDYARFLDLEKRASVLDPATPRYLYNVACGQALTGDARGAVQTLDQLLSRKLDLGAENDTDFAGIHDTPEWREFQSKLAALRKPDVHSETAFTLPDPGLIATGIAFDPQTGDFFIASVRERKIVRRSKDGKVSDFIPQAQDGFLAGASVAVDASRRLLIASTASVPFMLGYKKEDAPQSGVFVFDLKSGKLLRKAWLASDGKPHFLNALVLAKNGDIYVSDSLASGVYRLPLDKDQLETFIPPATFQASQGLAFSDDERTLYIADFADGLWAFDMASKTRRKIEAPPQVWLGGMDGLSRVSDSFITVQIGVKPERVLHLKLDASGSKLASVDVLEIAVPQYEGPIQGTIAEGAFFYVANSQLDLPNQQTGDFPADKARPTIVLRLPMR
jgi:sugar lactone lactonase YvrE